MYDIEYDLKFSYILYNTYHILQFKKNVSPNWCVWLCWSSYTSQRRRKYEEKYCSGLLSKERLILSILSIVCEAPGRVHNNTVVERTQH